MAEPLEGTHPEFERTILPHLEYLYSVAVRLTGNHTNAEDLVQDAILRAIRYFAGLRNREQPRLWLTRVLITTFYDRLRRRGEQFAGTIDEEFDLFDKIAEEDPFPYSDRVHLDFLELFDNAKILEVLQRIHPASRTALILAYVYDYTTREIAKILDVPIGTVLARLHRARKQLERELWEYAHQHRLLTPHEEARL